MHISCAACGPPATPQPDWTRPLNASRVLFDLSPFTSLLTSLFISSPLRLCVFSPYGKDVDLDRYSTPLKMGGVLYTLYILLPSHASGRTARNICVLRNARTGTKSFVTSVGDGIGYQPNLTCGPPVRATPHPFNICGKV